MVAEGGSPHERNRRNEARLGVTNHATAPSNRVSPESSLIDSAIARVLAAEAAARESVALCASQAEVRVQQAHERARAIAERGAARAARVHEWTAAAIARRLAEIESQRLALAAHAAATEGERQRLRDAVERLADMLAGASDTE
jgi:hypothetical protein